MQINFNTLTTAILDAVVGIITRDKWNINIELSNFYFNNLKEMSLDFTTVINPNFIKIVDNVSMTINGITVLFLKNNSLIEDEIKIYNNTDLLKSTTLKEIDNKHKHLTYSNERIY